MDMLTCWELASGHVHDSPVNPLNLMWPIPLSMKSHMEEIFISFYF